MVIKTNRYAQQMKAQLNLPAYARIRFWTDTNADEIRAFIAIRMAMGLAPKCTIQDHFPAVSGFLAY